MGELRIRATLGVKPEHNIIQAPAITYLTRGASGSIDFDLEMLDYFDSKDPDQITFIFKQGKVISSYNMFDYLVPTTDTEIDSNKAYYTQDGELVEDFTEVLVEDLYEIAEDNGYLRAYTPCLIDRHFELLGETIRFWFDTNETLEFKPTQPEDGVQFEVVLRFGDRVLIEPQLPLMVIDSLSGQIK